MEQDQPAHAATQQTTQEVQANSKILFFLVCS